MAPGGARRKKNGQKAKATIPNRSENDADNPSEPTARADRASTRTSAREESARVVADMVAPTGGDEDLNDLSSLTPPTRSTNGRTSINGSADRQDRHSQISKNDHNRSSVGAAEDRDHRRRMGSGHGTQRTDERTERSSRRGGGRANASYEGSQGAGGRTPPLLSRGTDNNAATDLRSPKVDDRLVAWDMDSRTLVTVRLPYVGRMGRTIEWDDHSNRLQITKSKPAAVGTSARPTGIALANRPTPTSEPVEDVSLATRWIQDTDQSINMALRRLAELTDPPTTWTG